MADPRNPRSGSRPPAYGGRDRERPRPQAEELRDIFPNYLQEGYFEAGRLREVLIRRTTVDRLARAMANATPALTSNQARRFFQHCRAIEERLLRGRSWLDEKHGSFMKLDGAAAEACAKREVPPIFEEFIRRNVDRCQEKDDFIKGFLPHFEALIAFGSARLKNKEMTI